MSETGAAVEVRVLSERDQRVLALVRSGPRYVVEVARELGLKHWTAKGSLDRLARDGFVRSWLVRPVGKRGVGRRYYGTEKPPDPAQQ